MNNTEYRVQIIFDKDLKPTVITNGPMTLYDWELIKRLANEYFERELSRVLKEAKSSPEH